MKSIKIGLIGSGMVAQLHLKALSNDPRAQVRWLADLSETARKSTGETFKIPHLAADHRQMLADPELDAVIICTPPKTHVNLALDVLSAGKHLLVEKPISTSIEDVRRLVGALPKYPKLKVSGCTARHARLTPKFAAIKRVIDQGKLGRIYHIHHRSIARQSRPGIEYNPPAKWFLDKTIAGGGPLYDWGGYDLSFHLGLLGEPQLQKVEAFCINGLDKVDAGTEVFTVEEHGAAFMTFAGGIHYYWERACNAHCDIPNQTTIYGTEGGLRFGYCSWDSPEIEIFYIDDGGRGKPQKDVIKVEMAGHEDELAMDRAWLDYLCDQGPVPMPLELELKNLEILHKVYTAAEW